MCERGVARVQGRGWRERKAAPARAAAAGGGGGGGAGSLRAEADAPTFAGTLGRMVVDISCVACGDESGAFWLAIWLAFFNQAR